jgi:hypothetical protein
VSDAAGMAIVVTAATHWTAISAVLVGIGALATAVMAYATFRVASKTEEMASAATKEAKAVEDQLRASVQPWLTWEPEYAVNVDFGANPDPIGDYPTSSGTYPSVDLRERPDELAGYIILRNVGNGLALIDTRNSWVIGEHDDYTEDRQYVTLQTKSPVVAVGTDTILTFHIPKTSSVWSQLDLGTFTRRRNSTGHFRIEVVYKDAVQGNSNTAKIKISSPEVTSDWWTVHQIDYMSRNNDEEHGVSVRF